MKKFITYATPLGVIGSIFYLIHVFLGQALWSEYNPITTDISTLTASGSPNRGILMVFTTIYGAAMILFAVCMILRSKNDNNKYVFYGWIIYLVMQFISFFGYMLFPLSENKNEMSFTNIMHIVVTMLVVLTTISSGFIISIGYYKNNKKKLGIIGIILSCVITLSGMLNPIGMGNDWNILGLTERITIFTLLLFSSLISLYFTYNDIKEKSLQI